jgi:hypothetical protein
MVNLSSVAYEKKFPPGLTGEDQPIFPKQLRLDPTVWKIVYGYLWSSSQEICPTTPSVDGIIFIS